MSEGMCGNPDELGRIAGEIEKRADGVRDRAKKLVDDARKMECHSVAAERCRETVGGDKLQLEKAADGLIEALLAARSPLRLSRFRLAVRPAYMRVLEMDNRAGSLLIVATRAAARCDEQVNATSWCLNQETKVAARAMVAVTESHECRDRVPHHP